MSPLGGGLMQLVALGAQDVYLVGNLQNTYFKVNYCKRTNFSMDAIEGVIEQGAIDPNKNYFEIDHLELLKHVKSLEDFKYVMLKECLEHIDKRGNNYYMLMCMLGMTEILKYLEKEHDYDPNVRNNDMIRAYDIALGNMDIELMEYLEENEKYTGPVLFKFKEIEKCEGKCMVCQENIKKDEIYCKCEHNHIIHKECCLVNEQYNNRLPMRMDEKVFDEETYGTECLYCKNKVLNKSFKCL